MDELTKKLETLSAVKRALLERRLNASQPQLLRRMRREPARASFAQERLWFLQQLEPESAAYNVPRAIRILGPVNLATLEQSLNEIIRRHESLRTTFSLSDGILMQIVAKDSRIPVAVIDLTKLSVDERAIKV